MKKQLLNLGFIAMGLALLMGSAIATPIQPYRTLFVPAAYGPDRSAPELDGNVDDVYSAEQSTDWMYPNQQPAYGGPTDFTAVFHLCYDLDYLYCVAIITDDVEEDYDWTLSSPWMFDNVEFFLQLDTNTTYTAYDALTEQMRVCRNLDSVETAGNLGRAAWGYYMEPVTGTGWITEVAIPWATAADDAILPEDITVYIADAIGFDFSGADSDNTDADPTVGNRDYQTAWDLDGQDGTEDQAWQNVTTFGYITFEIPLGIDPVMDNTVRAYPNPAGNSIIFEITGMENVDIYNITGTKVMSQLTTGMVDISSLKSGIYVARIGNDSVRFVKE
jgi:hypothetical protein